MFRLEFGENYQNFTTSQFYFFLRSITYDNYFINPMDTTQTHGQTEN